MAKDKENTGAQHAIVPADKRQLQRQPDESEKAHKARVAYCKLEPSQRTIAAAYRVFKGMEPDAEVKVPGIFRRLGQAISLEGVRDRLGRLFQRHCSHPQRRADGSRTPGDNRAGRAAADSYQAGNRAAEGSRPAPPLVARRQRRQNSRPFTPGDSTQRRISRPPCSVGRNSPRP